MNKIQPGLSTRLIRIGNICVQWSLVEYHIAHVIWRLLALDMETGKIITGGLDMVPRLNMAIVLARHMKVPRYVEIALTKTRKAIQDGLDIERNRAVHGVNLAPESPGVFRVEMHRGKGPKTPIGVSNDTLIRVGNELNNLGKELSILHTRMSADAKLRSLIAIARNTRWQAEDSVSDEGSKSASG